MNNHKSESECYRLMLLGEMVASVTHEINNPLGISITAVSNLKELLHELKVSFENGELSEDIFLEVMADSSEACEILSLNLQRATELVNGFKVNAVNQVNDSISNLNLHRFITSTLLSLSPIVKKNGILIESIFKIDENDEITSIKSGLSQIITNLILNAVKHAFDGISQPKITFTTEFFDNNEKVRIIVKDNGVGVDDTIKDKIFSSYFTTKSEQGGSGLGLSIVGSIIKNDLEGSIQLNTGQGLGCEFILEFKRHLKRR